MNNPYIQRVYQKLAHSRGLLSIANDCSSTIPERQKAEALVQGALIHLAIAYRFYLRELASRYGMSSPDAIVGLEGLRQSLFQAGKCAPEVDELEGLESPDGWLGGLLAAELEVLDPPVTDLAIAAGLIAVSSSAAQPLSCDVVVQWCQNLSDLSERQRASGEEF